MHQVALNRAGPDDGDLDARRRKNSAAACAAAWPSARGSRPGRCRSCRPRTSGRRSRDRPSAGARDRPAGRALAQSSRLSCSTAIMPRPSRSTLMMPRSSQSSLSHCATTRPGMRAFSSGTIESSWPWQMIMPPECWPRCRGRPWMRGEEPQRRPGRADAPSGRPACRSCACRSRVCGKSPLANRLEKRSSTSARQVQRLADLAHGAAAAEGDDVRRHGRAVPAVAAINLLDDALAPVAARQIEIDVRPALAAFAEEALEEQVARDRIDRRDAEAVADRAVGRAAAALHQDVRARGRS